MKGILIILNLYLLLLPLIPCSDEMECESTHETEQTSKASHGDDHNDEACTPFCYCSCCPASAFTDILSNDITEISVVPTQTDKYLSSHYSFNFNFIWQPPKIG